MEGLVRELAKNAIPAQAFWKRRRVLITGHTGFKGSWLWQWLEAMGAEPSGFALPPNREPSLFGLTGLDRRTRSRFGDIRGRPELEAYMSSVEPEIVFHLAAQSLVQPSYREPLATLETNILGTANVLDAAQRTPSVRCIVIVTSDKCYRPATPPAAHREHDPLGGHDPYSASKACAEIVTECWRRSFCNIEAPKGIASVRAGNVIGGGDWAPDRLIPDCIRAFQGGRRVHLRNPNAVRAWQHALDALAGYLVLAERLHGDAAAFGRPWNFGPDPAESATVQFVVERFSAHWGGDARWAVAEGTAEPEAPSLLIDSTEARTRLGWRPLLNLDESLAWTAEWHRKLAAGESAAALCAEQIARYAEGGAP